MREPPSTGGLAAHQHGVGEGEPVLLQGLEGQVQGDDLGEGGGGNLLVRVLLVQNPAGSQIHGDGRFDAKLAGGGMARRLDRPCRQHDEQHCEDEDSAFFAHGNPQGLKGSSGPCRRCRATAQ